MLEKWPAFIAISYVNLLSIHFKVLHVIFLYIYFPTHLITHFSRNICDWMNWKGEGAQRYGENIATLQRKWKLFYPDLLFATPWTVACRLLYSWNFPGKNIEVGSHFFLQGDLSNPGIKPGSPALQADSSPSEPPGKPASNTEGNLLSGFGFDCSAHFTCQLHSFHTTLLNLIQSAS